MGENTQERSVMSEVDNWKPEKGWLTELEERIPRNAGGDPEFSSLSEVLTVFTPRQVAYLVNKQLYALMYQKDHHRKRAAAQREAEAPVKAKLKEMFPGTAWIKATDQQIVAAIMAVKADREGV